MANFRCFINTAIIFLCCLQPLYASGPPWKFIIGKEKASVSFGFLAQPQFELLGNSNGTGSAKNLFMRRSRLIAGGKIGSKLSFFIESDSANLGKKATDWNRTAEIFLQDAYINYAFRPEFQFDGGMLLIPVSRNSGQSAASLLPIDYGPYSFLSSDPTHCKIGRDYGLQARGYIKKHLEYRFGVFRGKKDNNEAFPYRYVARLVWYPFDADTGLFYTGTTHGLKKIIGIGATLDRQAHYSANAIDLFIDKPLGNGNALTIRADFIRYDGGTTFTSLPKQNAWLLEGSYFIRKARLGPFIQFACRDYTNPASSDEKKVQGGVAFWIQKHRLNIKAGLARLLKTGAADRTQFAIQTQFFCF
jgi:hypothetical protein